MPIYEYRCKKCGDFETMQRISDPPLRRCPTCRAKVTKLISNTSFQLKGSGWYITDYARKDSSAKDTGKESSTKESGTESAGKEKGTEAKSDSGSDGGSKTADKTSKPSKSDSKHRGGTTQAAAA